MEERASSSLQEIPADFYISMDGKLSKLYRQSQNLELNELIKGVIERMDFLRHDLAQIRLAKILNSVIHKSSIDSKVLTWGERNLVKDLMRSIETLGVEKANTLLVDQNSFSEMDFPEGSESIPIKNVENKTNMQNKEDNLLIRLIVDVDAFVGLNNKVFGPLKKFDVVFLPTKNAKALIARGLARMIETNNELIISGENK
jgi:DNA replication initiation complex subunit (GINS family)